MIPLPPSGITGPLRRYLQDIAFAINALPAISLFSGTAITPNSQITGVAGNITIYAGPSSTNTRFFIKGGSASVPSTTSWATVQVIGT